jgi:hypothetical protein
VKSSRAGLALLAVTLLVGSCTSDGGVSSSSSVTSSSTTTTTTLPGTAEAVEAFVVCLNENGVAVDEIPLDANGRPRLEMLADQLDYSDPETVDALTSCSPLLSEGALDLAFDDSYRQAVVAELEAFSRCLRARGVEEFPDPTPGFIGIGPPYPTAEIPYSDPELPAAVEACERAVLGDEANG